MLHTTKMAYSVKIIQNGYTHKNGETKIYLRVIINRVKKLISLNISWPSEYFDKVTGKLLPRTKDDAKCADYILIINQSLARSNEIFVYHRLIGQPLTLEKFVKDFKSDLSKKDFIKYYNEKAKSRYRDGEIEHSTYQDHLKTYRKLQIFSKTIFFADVDENFGYTFDAFLKKNIKSRTGDSHNMRWAHHKNVRTYMRLAMKDHVKMVDAYRYFKISPKDGNWKAIYEADVMKLWHFYNATDTPEELRKATGRFLFMVYTGLRRCDLDRAGADWLNDGEIHYIAQKNKRFGKVTKVPLSKDALRLWRDAIEISTTGKRIFKYFSEQNSNKKLKAIAERLGIVSPIHHHIGRHTFITLLLKNGASLDMTSKYAGHATVGQTMKYNHPDEERRKREIKVMDLINPALPPSP